MAVDLAINDLAIVDPSRDNLSRGCPTMANQGIGDTGNTGNTRNIDTIDCPFRIVVDDREKKPYTFENIKSDAKQGYKTFLIGIMRGRLKHGDYQVYGYPNLIVERKSKSDLFSSVVKRDNFKGRLAALQTLFRVSFIVVECPLSEIRNDPPTFLDPATGERKEYLSPKVVGRSIISWEIDYPTVHWIFETDRRCAELRTFRILEKHYHKSLARLKGR